MDAYGLTTDIIWINGEAKDAVSYVYVPDDALPALSEGFCPDCTGVPLAGDTGNWCPACGVYWHIRHAGSA